MAITTRKNAAREFEKIFGCGRFYTAYARVSSNVMHSPKALTLGAHELNGKQSF
jgi:hypothetical protein